MLIGQTQPLYLVALERASRRIKAKNTFLRSLIEEAERFCSESSLKDIMNSVNIEFNNFLSDFWLGEFNTVLSCFENNHIRKQKFLSFERKTIYFTYYFLSVSA